MIVENETAARTAALSEAKRALLARRLRGEALPGARATGIPRRPGDHPAPLSSAQQRLWFFQKLEPASPLYNVPVTFRLRGKLDAAALQVALDAIVARHEPFRTRCEEADGEPRQVVSPPVPAPLRAMDLSGLPEDRRGRDLDDLLARESRRPFDVATDVLLRGLVVRLCPVEHVLLLVMHHIATDGWSCGIVFQELAVAYEAAAANRAPVLPPLPIRYADYAAWQRDWLGGPACARQRAYWLERLAGAPALLDLPTDRPRPPAVTFRGDWELLRLPPDLVAGVREVGRRHGATLFMTLLAAFQVLLHRLTGQSDLVVGTPVAGRTQVQTERLAGFFVNTLAIRTDLADAPDFPALVRQVRERTIEAFANQEVPFDVLIESLRIPRSPQYPPLVQVMFVLQNTPDATARLPGLEVTPLESRTGTAKFDLTLSIEQTMGGHVAALEYNSDLIDRGTAARWLVQYRTLLEGIVADDSPVLADLPVVPDAEMGRMLGEWSGRESPYPRDATIDGLFAAQVERCPDAVALADGHGSLSYRELDERANRLARRLLRIGVVPGSPVAVCLDRSIDTIVGLLAVLKAGGAYAGLDAAEPVARLADILGGLRARVLLTTEARRDRINATVLSVPDSAARPYVICVDTSRDDLASESPARPEATTGPASTAYISFTSGSTGRPKGVCVPHRGVVRLVRETNYADFDAGATFLHYAPVAFDASTFEIWGALLNGARIAIPPAGVLSLRELGDFIERHGVTMLWLTTGLFNELVDAHPSCLRRVKHLLTGGEVASLAHFSRARQLLPGTRLTNLYGPTENTTFTTFHDVDSPPSDGSPLPIGRPIANTRVYLLDDQLRPVPVGVPGQLHAGGDGVALGYLGQPELTATRFVPDPFAGTAGARLYATGDRARWRPDGTIEFLGRSDRQLKVRGFRVEPAEIETRLARHVAVRQALVVSRGAGDAGPRLVAYVVPAGGTEPSAPELRQHLREQVPEHMVPAAFVFLASLPLKASGKVDHAALPDPEAAPAGETGAPRDEVERNLAEVWSSVLGVPGPGIHDNFFELGGHSLAAVRLFARIEQRLGVRLPLATLFHSPTIARLAAHLRRPGGPAADGPLVALQPKGNLPPVFFVHGAGRGNLWTYANLAPHLGSDQPVYALESRAAHGQPEFEHLEEMAAHYVEAVRRVQPRGPYSLGGYCFGGNVAFEMARQLAARGEEIALLAMLDAAPANSGYESMPWWRPVFLARFVANAAWWIADFAGLPPAERGELVRRKVRAGLRRLRRRLARRTPALENLDLEEFINVSLFPPEELELWKAHLRAVGRYHPGAFPGRVTLFRTRGQPVFCSLDPEFNWREFAHGGVDVVRIPGSHEKIFMEPNVSALGAALRGRLAAARAAHHPPSAP